MLKELPSFRRRLPPGFTLIEILIVISIIALLSSLVLVAVNRARQGASEAIARTQVGSFNNALNQYVQDESEYPGMDQKADPDRNDFPKLFNAIFGEPRPRGPGGRSAPYVKCEEDKVIVLDEDSQDYRKATREEVRDVKISKYYRDPWGYPYWYRVNKGKKYEDYMHNQSTADIFSTGPNGEDDTVNKEGKSDDIGNW